MQKNVRMSTWSIEKVDKASAEKREEGTLETLVKSKAINEIQVTFEEATVEATTVFYTQNKLRMLVMSQKNQNLQK